MTVLQENEGGGRQRGRIEVVYTRLIYSSLQGRRTIHARQQLLRITSRLLPYSQWMSRDRCCITNNVSVDLHVAWGMCTQRTRGSHYCAAVTTNQQRACFCTEESYTDRLTFSLMVPLSKMETRRYFNVRRAFSFWEICLNMCVKVIISRRFKRY